jgi:hypothetical protein
VVPFVSQKVIMLRTYITLDNDVLDLSALSAAEADQLGRCWAAFIAGDEYPAVMAMAQPPGGFVSRAYYESPLGQALQDVEFRAGIKAGMVGAEPGDDIASNPFRDESVSVAEAAAAKSVTVRAVHKAIERGELVASGRPAKISRTSLDRWRVSLGRQKAGRAAAASR